MTLNLEGEEINDPKWWKRYRKEIEKAKKEFIESGKIGGNPLGIPGDKKKEDIKYE